MHVDPITRQTFEVKYFVETTLRILLPLTPILIDIMF